MPDLPAVVPPGPAREVYRDAKPGFLTAVSRDGRQGLFLRYPSRSENHLLRVDLASGKTTELYPGSGKVSIADAQFSPDGRTVYVATDGGGEQAWLLALDADSGKEKGRYVERDPPIATISGVDVAKKGGGLAVAASIDQASVGDDGVDQSATTFVPSSEKAETLPCPRGIATLARGCSVPASRTRISLRLPASMVSARAPPFLARSTPEMVAMGGSRST